VLLGGDVDAIAGLLVLRERQAFTVYAPTPLLDLLRANPIFGVLNPEVVRLEPIRPEQPVSCGGGLQLTLLEMPGKVPLYMEEPGAASAESGPTYAARLQAGASTMVFAPACADISDTVRQQLNGAEAVFFDGTLFTDDEMIAAGLGIKTGHRMGHVPVSGPGGSLEFLRGLRGRRILMHINNTNPILLSDSAERQQVEAAGIEVAYDGMEVRV
jgi:pyrroloquinoline quinone biosynthesis protein B